MAGRAAAPAAQERRSSGGRGAALLRLAAAAAALLGGLAAYPLLLAPQPGAPRAAAAGPTGALARGTAELAGSAVAARAAVAGLASRAAASLGLGPASAARPAFLEESSLFALGADARARMARFADVPLVTWDPAAADALAAHWRAVQMDPGCGRVLYVHPFSWGITSCLRDMWDFFLPSVFAWNRTVVWHPHAHPPPWCAPRGGGDSGDSGGDDVDGGGGVWLECFFGPLANPACGGAPEATPELDVNATTLELLAGPGPVYALKPNSRFVDVPKDPALFPGALWDSLVAAGLVRLADSRTGAPLDSAVLRAVRPRLHHAVALAALRSMTAGAVWRPRPRVAAAAARLATAALPGGPLAALLPSRRRCVALHLRWTDKASDLGAAAGMVGRVDHVPAALERIHNRTGRAYRCLLVLTDDDDALVPLRAALGPGYDVRQITPLRPLAEAAGLGWEEYRARGHSLLRYAHPRAAEGYYSSVILE
jgi:hypothetical protein